jgi:hypothetical protein
LLILILPLHWSLFAHAGVHAGIGQEAGFASSSLQRKPLNCAQASVLLRRVECHALEYLGTLSVVTALVVFVGLSFGHGETKQSEDQRIALLLQCIRDSGSDEFPNRPSHGACAERILNASSEE